MRCVARGKQDGPSRGDPRVEIRNPKSHNTPVLRTY